MPGYPKGSGTPMNKFAKAEHMASINGSENSVLSKDGKRQAGWKSQLPIRCFSTPAENER
jgi:hypothetical protein